MVCNTEVPDPTIRALERLISVAGHELRNPMQIIELQVDVLLEQLRADEKPVQPEVAIAQLESIRRQTAKMAELIGTLLDVGAASSGQLDLAPEDVDLADIVRTVVADSEELSRSRPPITLDIQPARGRWDRLRLGQVATNLISNAVKYGLGKPINVTVDRVDGVARLVVQDQGIGVPRDAVDRLFRPFERVGSVKTAAGLGLGLYISAQIVRAHGGTISVDSEPGSGTSFVVELPVD